MRKGKERFKGSNTGLLIQKFPSRPPTSANLLSKVLGIDILQIKGTVPVVCRVLRGNNELSVWNCSTPATL
jgi:hypothetical protein